MPSRPSGLVLEHNVTTRKVVPSLARMIESTMPRPGDRRFSLLVFAKNSPCCNFRLLQHNLPMSDMARQLSKPCSGSELFPVIMFAAATSAAVFAKAGGGGDAGGVRAGPLCGQRFPRWRLIREWHERLRCEECHRHRNAKCKSYAMWDNGQPEQRQDSGATSSRIRLLKISSRIKRVASP